MRWRSLKRVDVSRLPLLVFKRWKDWVPVVISIVALKRAKGEEGEVIAAQRRKF